MLVYLGSVSTKGNGKVYCVVVIVFCALDVALKIEAVFVRL